MADEIKMTTILSVDKDNLSWGPKSEDDAIDMTNGEGPSPGYIEATTTGTTVDLSALTTPGMCKIKNLDDTNYVEYGPYSGGTFYPLGEILADNSVHIRLSRNIAALRLKANSATCKCVVEAFSA